MREVLFTLLCLLGALGLRCAAQRPQLPWNASGPCAATTADLNNDGRPDVFCACNADDNRDNAACEEYVDWNGDGLPEVHRYFENGQLSLQTFDLHFDGRPSLWLHYLNGQLALKEWDNDGDGVADQHAFLLEQSWLDLLARLLNSLAHPSATDSMPAHPPCCPSP